MKIKNRLVVAAILLLHLLTACSQADKAISQGQTKSTQASERAFVKVDAGKLTLQGKPYYFAGANFWQAALLGAAQKPGDRKQLIRELDALKANGISNLRILAVSESSQLTRALSPAVQSSPGQLQPYLLEGLDFLLAEMAKRDMKAVLVLNNFWQWSGGMAQYVAWNSNQSVFDPDVTGDWSGFIKNAAGFYSLEKAQQQYQSVIRQVIERQNTISGVTYKNDPTIMSWELANEPRPGADASDVANVSHYINWIDNTAKLIHQLAPKQLVTTGSEGIMGSWNDDSIYLKAHMLPSVDYITFHVWPKNWGWIDIKSPDTSYDQALQKAKDYAAKHIQFAAQLNKPVVMEEFGLERDGGSFKPAAGTNWRDKFFSDLYQYWYQAAKAGANIGGSNFWAWSGEARNNREDSVWQTGDAFLADPPHEPQGLNSVFDTDKSTLAVIKQHAEKMAGLANQPTIAQKVDALISKMSLAEKIGQMTQAERNHATPQDVKDYFLGSILNGGGSVPGNNTPQDWREMIDAYQHAALSTRLGIPFIYGTDAVHGHGNGKNTTLFPHNVGLGAMRNPQLMEQIGRITAAETTAFGVHWNFGPALCVSRDERWGRAYECYGEQPEIGESYAGLYVHGSQATGQMLATAKHWVGDGGTTYGTGDHEYIIDRGDTRVSMDELRNIHIAPYLPAFEQHVGSVMFSYSSVNGVKMHENTHLNNEILKGELGFDGFVVSDWQAIEEVRGETNRERIVRSINAGLDMAMEPEFWKEFIQDLTAAVNDGEVPISRIDDAVRRILTQKYKLGLFERPYSADRSVPAELAVGTDEHRAVAREAVAESLVMLKNDNNLLPFKKDASIFVAGSHANNIGLQSGGWSIQWQGEKQSNNQGTTILAGIKQQASNVTFSEDGSGAKGHDVAIVVVGEDPYAEGWGDYNVPPCQYCQPLTLKPEQVETLKRVKASGVPMLVILISGRPLLIADQIGDWDALVAAWLPGTEGAGVADVLFGEHAMGGKLSVSWPRTLQQIPINVGDKNYDPLFEYGFGLTYEKTMTNQQ
ncbi:glycoside hydrolase family 3 N-terminal domain-containing protein [Neptunicella marina]|uniref:beta-glucosidase n=1 Tax=Neptunicella marina TaxID=2125989 RepID=A0A8J6IVE7_9ALTE|nr:glycoside hydrolase family 3 N-terminal domain-containing protein [Neptunicella marina]MBC3766198.1 glycoside hydrolase family 3 C-terminal domain-containing protein [Neptunicella marina]